jgi:hypothetical protein
MVELYLNSPMHLHGIKRMDNFTFFTLRVVGLISFLFILIH